MPKPSHSEAPSRKGVAIGWALWGKVGAILAARLCCRYSVCLETLFAYFNRFSAFHLHDAGAVGKPGCTDCPATTTGYDGLIKTRMCFP